MSDPRTVKENKDNDRKYLTGLEDPNDQEKPISESGRPEDELEYFTD